MILKLNLKYSVRCGLDLTGLGKVKIKVKVQVKLSLCLTKHHSEFKLYLHAELYMVMDS